MSEKVLVVDDDIDSLKLIGLMLQRNGYEVVAANAGAQALARAVSDKPDLIILDVMMPDMSGYEVCRRLRKNPETKAIPIIMFTAKTLIDDKVAGFEAGADDYLTKPTHPAELASRVRAILSRNVGAARPTPLSKGSTIGILGAKGGVGATTLALNLAAARQSAGDNPIVADFRLGAGSMGLLIGAGRAQGMANVLSKPVEEIRTRLIEPELTVHPSGLRALLSSARAKEAQLNYSLDAAVAVVRNLRSMGRPAVFDIGSGLTPLVQRLNREMDQLIVVVDQMPTTLIMAREIMNELDTARPDNAKTGVVVVQRAATSSPVSWQEVEEMLGREIRGSISLASDLFYQALQANAPAVIYQPSAIASSQLIKLAEEIGARGRSAQGEV